MSAHSIPRLTPEQYLEIERAAEFKSEYHDGQMFAMSGGTLAHSLIGTQLLVTLALALRGKACRAANSDLRVGISSQGPFVYPDAIVYCGEPQLADEHRDMLLNPAVIFEILSKSSEGYDRGYKFAQYRRIESVREYVLISQTEPRIEVFGRQQDGKWSFTEFVGMEAVCQIPGIGVEFPVEQIYRDVSLES